MLIILVLFVGATFLALRAHSPTHPSTPTTRPKTTTTTAAKSSSTTVPKSQVSVQVANGTTVTGLAVGSEEKGLAPLTRKRCEAVVSIPQLGKISSLNAGVAVSVAAFEVARQRNLPKK